MFWRAFKARFGAQNSAFAAFLARPVPRGGFAGFWRHKNLKNRSFGPFQSRCTLIHTARTRWLCPGCLLRKPPVRTIDAKSVGRFRFGSAFETASQRFNAGWSSPVARQAHNLKVIGSNPIPATKLIKTPGNLSDCRGFFVPEVDPNNINGLTPIAVLLAAGAIGLLFVKGGDRFEE
jgi:hypothetical protein